MFGLPVVHIPIFLEGSNGYIIAIDFNILRLSDVDNVIVAREDTNEVEIINTETTLKDLTLQINDPQVNCAYYNSGDALYILFRKDIYPYRSETKFIVTGTRSALPITSEDDYIDIPEEYLELFMFYVHKYIYLFQGKKVQPDIELAINNLEVKLKENKE